MEILFSLGVNKTFFFQLGLFLLLFAFLYKGVFTLYYEAYLKRKEVSQTEETSFSDVLERIEDLKKIYKEKAQELNKACEKLYLDKEKQALQKKEKMIKESLADVEVKKEEFLRSLRTRSEELSSQLHLEIEPLSKVILNQVLPFQKKGKPSHFSSSKKAGHF